MKTDLSLRKTNVQTGSCHQVTVCSTIAERQNKNTQKQREGKRSATRCVCVRECACASVYGTNSSKKTPIINNIIDRTWRYLYTERMSPSDFLPPRQTSGSAVKT